jgi:CubicO group peptidase (beta-lactamase class C family)
MSQPEVKPVAEQPMAERLHEVFAPFDKTDAPGLVVAVAHQGQLLYRRGLGMASLELGVANTPHTRMSLGSTAKHMTAAIVLVLQHEGLLDIDAPVRAYLPELQPQDPEPTLRQLMTHTSGYRCYLDLSFVGNGLSMKPKGYAFEMQRRQRDRNFAAGRRMLYCNGGYHLLSLIAEKVAGVPFRDLLQERLFRPLGMRDTQAVESDFEIHRGMATQHVPRPGGGWGRGVFPSEESRGDGAVISTVDDMLAWMRELRRPDAFGIPGNWLEMTAHTVLANGTVSEYGLGLVRNDYRGVELVHHAGGIVGGSCQMLMVPAHGLDIIIISNGAPLDPSALALRVVDTVLQPHLRATTEVQRAKAADVAPLLGRSYASPSGMLVGFTAQEAGVGFSMLGNYSMPMNVGRDGQLQLTYGDTGVGPFEVLLPPGPLQAAPATLSITECGEPEVYTLLPERVDDPDEALRPLQGTYRCDDMDSVAVVELGEDGTATLQIADPYGASTADLQPLGDGTFLSRMRPPMLPVPAALRVEERDARGVRSFRLNAARTRHLKFTRIDASS